jgi:carbamoyltransferase
MTQWIAAIARGHNSGVCLLKDGELIISIEEERLSRHKYDGGPLASMVKILEYTDKLDYLVIAHTQPLGDTGRVDFTGDDIYTGLARKLGLISRKEDPYNHPQVIDLSRTHHKLHAACAFYRSGFDSAVSVVVDGAGTFIPMNFGRKNEPEMTWELESIFSCEYPANFKTLYKHQAGRGPWGSAKIEEFPSDGEGEDGTHELVLDESAGITKAYEAVTQYCGWSPIEAGKTMGLFPYGKPNKKIPKIYTDGGGGSWKTADRNVIVPTYPNGAVVNEGRYEFLNTPKDCEDLTKLQNRRDLAYSIQVESQQMVLDLIYKAVEISGNKNVVLSGGYGLNCVANYWYLDELKKNGINLFVEPVSNDAGTAIGAALLIHHQINGDMNIMNRITNLYYGPEYEYSDEEIEQTCNKYGVTKIIQGVQYSHVVKLITEKNIVALFQGRSEAGPRALGNRSILYDPRDPNGKDHVNIVKRREYFRPFAGSILKEHVHDWFDLRGMDDTPFMMYAVKCQDGIEEKIPAIIHVDGTCRIQTVTENVNAHYYGLINEFYNQTGCPIIFNTSFNLGGEPLVETLDDALRTLANSQIEYLYLPEYNRLIEIKNND